MKATIDVNSREEARLIRAGLADESTRALVKIIGALAPIPGERAKRRVLNFVIDSMQDSGELEGLSVSIKGEIGEDEPQDELLPDGRITIQGP